jgi:hypothetical protein
MTIIYRVSLCILFFSLATPIFGEAKITPGDVFTKAKELETLVERIQFHMGVPKAESLKLKIKNAQPHDVFFQAQTLFNKTNRLLFQVLRTKLPHPKIAQNIYRPQDVLELVTGAERNLKLILKELKLSPDVDPATTDTTEISPSDVFLIIQGLNRQVNSLLSTPFSPSDVYMQVTLAIGYGAKQLARFPDLQRIPDQAEVAPGRIPRDVYFLLLGGLEQLQHIYEQQGLSSLEVDTKQLMEQNITPSDVFDIASLLVARLDFLHKHSDLETLPREPFYPGKVYPTDVYRQTTILLSQLKMLTKQLSKNRNR